MLGLYAIKFAFYRANLVLMLKLPEFIHGDRRRVCIADLEPRLSLN